MKLRGQWEFLATGSLQLTRTATNTYNPAPSSNDRKQGSTMRMYDVIEKKRDSGELTTPD